MAEKVKCDRCGMEYHDKASIEELKRTEAIWKQMVAEDDDVARGLGPCPILSCEGEMFLRMKTSINGLGVWLRVFPK